MKKENFSENLITVLKKMDGEELAKLELFLKSPYFNRRILLVTLFDYLKKFAPEFISEKYSKKNAFAEMYGDKPYNQGSINEAYSALYRLILKFLRQQQTEINENYQDILLLDTLKEMNLDKAFVKLSSEVEERLYSVPDTPNNLIDQYDAILAKYNYSMGRFTKSKAKFSEEELRLGGRAFRKLILFFVTNSTSLLANSFFLSHGVNKKESVDFSSLLNTEMINILLNGLKWDKREMILVTLYKKLFAVLKEPENEKYFEQYRKYINSNFEQIEKREVQFHFHFLMSLYINFYKKTGNIDFRFRILALRETILFEDMYISSFNKEFLPLSMRNIIQDYVNLQLPDRLNRLIPYVQKLSMKFRTAFTNYIKAYYHFLRGEFDDALNFALAVGNAEKRLLIDMDLMRIMVFFLSGEYEHCTDKINTVKRFLNDFEEMNEEIRQNHKKFLKTIQNTIHLLESKDTAGLSVLYDDTRKNVSMIYREWYSDILSSILQSMRSRAKRSKKKTG